MVRVRMDGYVLPVVNELTGVVSSHFFVPLEKDFADAATWDVEQDSLDEVVLSIQSYGPALSEAEQRRQEINWQERFTTTFLQELCEAKSRRLRGVSYFCDAAACASFTAGTGVLSLEHSSSILAKGGEAVGAIQLALLMGLFVVQGAKALRDARTREYAGEIADHFSTNLAIEYGHDMDLHAKVLALHDHFGTMHGPSRKINTAMAERAHTLGLPAVQKFYEKRIDPKKVEGIVFKLFDKGFLKSIADGFREWYANGNQLNVVEEIGRKAGHVPPQRSVHVNIPVTLLPSFDGYDVFVGYREYRDLSDLAARIGEGLDVDIAFEVFAPHDLGESECMLLERDLPLAIHDNVYRKSRIFNAIPKKMIEKGSKVGRYIGGGVGALITAGGISTAITESPLAGAAIIVAGAYLVARQFIFSKPLERANKKPYERQIRGYDTLSDMLSEANAFTYRTDPSLQAFDAIMAAHQSPYAAYVACVHQAKQFDWPDVVAHYVKKALSVQPIDHEERSGIMELSRGKS